MAAVVSVAGAATTSTSPNGPSMPDDSGPVEISGTGTFPKSGLNNHAVLWDVDFRYANGVTVHMTKHPAAALPHVHRKRRHDLRQPHRGLFQSPRAYRTPKSAKMNGTPASPIATIKTSSTVSAPAKTPRPMRKSATDPRLAATSPPTASSSAARPSGTQSKSDTSTTTKRTP